MSGARLGSIRVSGFGFGGSGLWGVGLSTYLFLAVSGARIPACQHQAGVAQEGCLSRWPSAALWNVQHGRTVALGTRPPVHAT